MSGNLYAKQRVNYLADLLEQIGLQRERIRMINISAGMGARFSELANEFCETVRELGPVGLKKHHSDKAKEIHQENPDADAEQTVNASAQ